MKKFLQIFPLFFITVYASGEFSVLHSPQSIEFKGDERLDAENICDVLAATLGFPVQDTANWSGLYLKDPFHVAQAAIAILVEGVNHLPLNGKVKTYSLMGYSAQESLDILTSSLEESSSLVVDLDLMQGSEALLTYSDIFGNISVPSNLKAKGNLKPSLHSADKLYLQLIRILYIIADKLRSIEKKPTLMTFRISLSPIASTHGEASPAMSEALKLLAEATENLKLSAAETFKDLLFVVIADKTEFVRSKRQADKGKAEINLDDLNLATYYSEDYPVIFNIMLWFGVIFTFSLLAISYAIATMDPGRDSIIYRMTSTRMKKDN